MAKRQVCVKCGKGGELMMVLRNGPNGFRRYPVCGRCIGGQTPKEVQHAQETADQGDASKASAAALAGAGQEAAQPDFTGADVRAPGSAADVAGDGAV